MPQPRQWTEAADLTISEMRGGGATWAEIGRALGLSRNTIIERGRRLGAAAPIKIPAPIPEEDVVSDDANREALPAGHPLTWGLLTDEPFPKGDLK